MKATNAQHEVITPLSAPVGRYVLHPAIARGSMATVHPAHLVGQGGFSRLVAAKRLRQELAEDPDLVASVQHEARIASRVHHPNVVPILDVIVADREVILVQEYVHGAPLRLLLRRAMTRREPVDVDVAVAVIVGILEGLAAIQQAKDESPPPPARFDRDAAALDVLVSVDGVARLLDSGIARSRQSDLYAVGLLMWQLLHPWVGADRRRTDKLARLEPIVARALASDPRKRHASAHQMLDAVLSVCRPAPATDVAAWVRSAGADHLEKRRVALDASEASWQAMARASSAPPPAPSSPPPAPARAKPLASKVAPFLPWVATAVSLVVVGILAGIAVEAARPTKVIERARVESAARVR